MKRSMITLAAAAASALVLAACGSAQSVDGGATASSTIVVGSQDYYSNEIIAEVYAQALEDAGYTVDRQMRIGQREVYMPEVAKGTIDVFPEYTGNLLQYLKADATETTSEDVYRALAEAMPEGLRALDIPAFSVQYHPEAAAGPHDGELLFDRFISLMTAAKETH